MQTHDSGLFCRIPKEVSRKSGSLAAFGVALGIVIAWDLRSPVRLQRHLAAGDQYRHDHRDFSHVVPDSKYAERDSAGIQLRLDEIIRSTNGAHNALLDLEKLSAHDLETIRGLYEKLAEQARRKQGGRGDTDTPEVTPAQRLPIP